MEIWWIDLRCTIFIVLLSSIINVNGYSKYGRTCKDIGCLPSESCILAYESCSYGQRENRECGSYPTCKRTGATTNTDPADSDDQGPNPSPSLVSMIIPSSGGHNNTPNIPTYPRPQPAPQPSYPGYGGNNGGGGGYAPPSNGGYVPPSYGGGGGGWTRPSNDDINPSGDMYGGNGGIGGFKRPSPSSSDADGSSSLSGILNALGGGGGGGGGSGLSSILSSFGSGGGGGGGGSGLSSILSSFGNRGGSGGGYSEPSSGSSGSSGFSSILNALGGSGGSGGSQSNAGSSGFSSILNALGGSTGNRGSSSTDSSGGGGALLSVLSGFLKPGGGGGGGVAQGLIENRRFLGLFNENPSSGSSGTGAQTSVDPHSGRGYPTQPPYSRTSYSQSQLGLGMNHTPINSTSKPAYGWNV